MSKETFDLGAVDEGFITFNFGEKEFKIDLFDMLKYFHSIQKQSKDGNNEDLIMSMIPFMRNYLQSLGLENVSGMHTLKFIRKCMKDIAELKKNLD